MITQIDSKTLHRLLNEAKDIFSLKISSLAKAYEGYDFCSFYGAKDILIGKYYEELIIRAKGGIPDEAAEELSLRVLRAGGLPGKTAPATAAAAVRGAVYHILEERGEPI